MKKILLLVMLGLSTSVFSQQTEKTTELEEVESPEDESPDDESPDDESPDDESPLVVV